MNKDDKLQELDEARNQGKISREEYIAKRDRIMNETIEGCGFCLEVGDKYCICHQKIKREMLIDLINKK